MSGGAVESNIAALIAVWCVNGEGSLIPSALEVGGDLCKGEGKEGKGKESGLAEHHCGGMR